MGGSVLTALGAPQASGTVWPGRRCLKGPRPVKVRDASQVGCCARCAGPRRLVFGIVEQVTLVPDDTLGWCARIWYLNLPFLYFSKAPQGWAGFSGYFSGNSVKNSPLGEVGVESVLVPWIALNPDESAQLGQVCLWISASGSGHGGRASGAELGGGGSAGKAASSRSCPRSPAGHPPFLGLRQCCEGDLISSGYRSEWKLCTRLCSRVCNFPSPVTEASSFGKADAQGPYPKSLTNRLSR